MKSLQTKPKKKLYSYTHTNFPTVEFVLQYLFVEGEENLALLLGKIYKDFYFLDPSKFNMSPLGRIQLTEDEGAKLQIQVHVH